MKENSAKYKQKSRAEGLPFAKSDEAAFLLVFLFPLSSVICIILLHDNPAVDSIHAYSGLFNRQGLDTGYEVYFVLLLFSPLLTTRLFSITLRTNRKVLAAVCLGIPYICRSIMMFMVRKRKYTLSQTPSDGRQVSENSSTVN